MPNVLKIIESSNSEYPIDLTWYDYVKMKSAKIDEMI